MTCAALSTTDQSSVSSPISTSSSLLKPCGLGLEPYRKRKWSCWLLPEPPYAARVFDPAQTWCFCRPCSVDRTFHESRCKCRCCHYTRTRRYPADRQAIASVVVQASEACQSQWACIRGQPWLCLADCLQQRCTSLLRAARPDQLPCGRARRLVL